MIDEISKDEIIFELMKNKYGNFVIKRGLKEGSHSEVAQLKSALIRNLPNLHESVIKNNWIEYLN